MTTRLSVVVVTYGERWPLLSRVLHALDRDASNLVEVVVVDNACGYDIEQSIEQIGLGVPVRVLHAASNTGSAGGFASGIAAVIESVPDGHVLLLDDDTVPGPGSIREVAETCAQSSDPSACWMMRRLSRPEIDALIRRGCPVRHTVSSYAGLSLRRRLMALSTGGRRRSESGTDVLEYAPYGGLVVPTAALARAGLPNADYHLYADDHEFTTRLVGSGCTIRLHPSATLDDVDDSWHTTTRTMIAALDPRIDPRRAYYATRNRRHLERTRLTQRPMEVGLNEAVYWTAVAVDCLTLLARLERPARIAGRVSTLRRALADGRAGRLGRADEHTLR